MTEKNLMCAIQMYDFYLYELNLYLDTHPSDPEALALFKETNEKRKAAYKAYVDKYGPITAKQFTEGDYFTWVDGPWPWERSAN